MRWTGNGYLLSADEHERMKAIDRWSYDYMGNGCHYPFSSPSDLFEFDARSIGITIEPSSKCDSSDRIDKHVVADAIEKTLAKCIEGTYVRRAPCDVCKAMGITAEMFEARETLGQEKKIRCRKCPASISVNGLDQSCEIFAEVINSREPNYARYIARAAEIIAELRATEGDARYFTFDAPKKQRTVKRTDMADVIEERLKEFLAGTAEGDGYPFDARLCKMQGKQMHGSACLGCPVDGQTSKAGTGCGAYKYGITVEKSLHYVRALLSIIDKLRKEGGEVTFED